MLDIWYTFPATMGEDQAWITYNHGYAEVAKEDPRNNYLRIRIAFKNPTEYGMPTNEEYPQLSALDELLDNTITKMGGVYVGRITVSGYRFFYFYVSESEEKVKEVIDPIADVSDYKIRYDYELDASKNYYWNELYPTDDDWQVIQDLKVLDSLIDEGDVKDRSRKVNHWAYFDIQQQANQYVQWVTEQAYKVVSNSKTEDDSEYLVQFSHTGTMHLGDITSHTIRANRKAKELGGRYDGWETSVERE